MTSPAVVFVHGIGGSARVWARQMASFAAAGYRPVASDLPGYGARPPVTAMTFEELAADVEASDCGARTCIGRCWSGIRMGGMVVQTALRRRPDGYRRSGAGLHQPGLRQSERRIPEKVRGRQAGAARRRQDHGRARAQQWSMP